MLVNTGNVAVFEPSTAIDIQQVPELKHNDMSTEKRCKFTIELHRFFLFIPKKNKLRFTDMIQRKVIFSLTDNT